MSQATEDDLHIHDAPSDRGRHLVEYVLVDHMRTIGAHFDPHATALDHRTWDYRIRNAALQRLKRVATEGRHYHGWVLSHLTSAMLRLDGVVQGPHHFGVSFCDRQRLVDAILALPTSDIVALTRAGTDTETEEERNARQAAATAAADRLAAIIGETVTITAKAPIRITQGTAEGETPATGTYDPNVEGAERLVLSECAIADAGVRIEALSPVPMDASVAALTVTNGLTGRVVTLAPPTNSHGLTAQIVAHNATRTLFGPELRVAWTLAVGKAEVSPPSTPTP